MREASCDCTKHWHCPRCSGANVAWEKPERWYCLDCGHELPNPIAASSPAGGEFGQCQECGCTTGGGDYCWQHRPYTVYPLKDGTWRETRNGLTRVIESNCNRCSELHADAARPRSAQEEGRAMFDAERQRMANNLLDAKYLNPECAESGCQFLRSEARSSPVEAQGWQPNLKKLTLHDLRVLRIQIVKEINDRGGVVDGRDVPQ